MALVPLAYAFTFKSFTLRERDLQKRAKEEANSSLADGLMGVRENLQDIREAMTALEEEKAQSLQRIRELEESLKLKAVLVRHQGVYWSKGDSDPWCPNCWENEQRAVHMNPTAVLAGRLCVCQRCDYNVNLDNVSPPKQWPE